VANVAASRECKKLGGGEVDQWSIEQSLGGMRCSGRPANGTSSRRVDERLLQELCKNTWVHAI